MSILGKQAILQAIGQGAITITPFTLERVGPASVDLTLVSTFRVYRKVHRVIEVCENTDYGEFTEINELTSAMPHNLLFHLGYN